MTAPPPTPPPAPPPVPTPASALPGGPDPDAAGRRREQRAWYWYDWANSAYVTTVATVLFAPYLIGIAEQAAVDDRVRLLVWDVAPGALPSYLITASTILSALALPLLGAVADRTRRKRHLLAGFAWSGAAFAGLLWFCTGENWEVGAVAIVGANVCLGASLVVNDSILCLVADETERDRVSSRGWAWGYLGGGVLLLANLALVTQAEALGTDEATAARISMLWAAVWWAAFTLVPFLGLRDHPPAHVEVERGGLLQQSFGQLGATLKDLRNYPVALTFLLAYLFFNDGIQTVIASSSTYGGEELGFGTGMLIATILMVQFVGVLGALLFGRLAGRFGAKPVIMGGLGLWMVIVAVALVLPAGGDRSVPRARFRHRPGDGWHAGAGAVLLLAAHPPGAGGRVLQLLPRDGPRDVLVRDAAVRARLPAHRVLPARDLRPRGVLRARGGAAGPRRHGAGRRTGPGRLTRPRGRPGNPGGCPFVYLHGGQGILAEPGLGHPHGVLVRTTCERGLARQRQGRRHDGGRAPSLLTTGWDLT